MLKDLVYALELGFKIIAVFLCCVAAGWYLDSYFHTRPVLMLVMILIAFVKNVQILLGVGKK